MPRFSLSNDEDEGEDLFGCGDNEEEPAHPLGFGLAQWGRTWIGLEPPSALILTSPGRSTYALDDGDDDEYAFLMTPYQHQHQYQTYPPLSSYIPAASTPALLKYRAPISDEEKLELDYGISMEEDEVLLLQRMLQRGSLTATLPPPTPTNPLPSFQETTRLVQQKVQLERQRMEQEHAATTKALQTVCLELEREAADVLKIRQLEQEETAKRIHEEKITREKQLKQQQADQLALEEKEQRRRAAQEDKLRQEERKREAREAKNEYVHKAKKLVTQLVAVRDSIEPFDNNKAVSKRRLGMKKIVRGKINTLSENAAKIQEVASEVSRAITEARAEDEQIKQALERKEPGFTPDMARGKRYLVDLVASNTIQRVQAEGFNGPRGDGFPLANMLAMISLENKELVPILAAHIYTVCPTAIPTLPTPASDASEEELMSSLGMLKGKNGEYETFDRFLSRTENIVALVANIMSSLPSSHVLLGGHRGAVDWLTRFLDLLPPPPTAPLPLLTAPVLHGFLTAAGHMLANKHADSFEKHVKTITEDVISRLDEGPIGKPSSIRLAKLMEGGLEKFRTTLPERALSELYYGAGGAQVHGSTSGVGAPFVASSTTSAFGSMKAPTSSANPFETSTGPSSAPNNPFGGASQPSSSTSSASPYGGGVSNPFGVSSSTVGGFGSTNSGTTGGFGAMTAESTPQSNPFGAAPTGAGGFGAPSSGASNPFGSSVNSSSNSAGNPFVSSGLAAKSPFGAAPSPFGHGSIPGTAAQSPFGSGISSNPSPFGVSKNSAPFGSSSGGRGFGGNSNAPASGTSPFGAVQPSNPSPLGVSNNSVPFGSGGGGFGGGNNNDNMSNFGGGGGRGNGGKPPCRFFAQGRCKFGDSCKFSHETGGGSSGGGGSFGASGSGGYSSGGRGSGGGFGNSGGGGRGFSGGSSQFSGGFGGGSASSPFGAPRR